MSPTNKKLLKEIQSIFMTKILERVGIQEIYLNIMKAIYSKLITKLKLNGEKLKTSPVKLNKTRLSTLTIKIQ